MKSKNVILILLFIILSQQNIAQTRTITGTIYSLLDNTALPGVSIINKGTISSTVSNSDGTYSIDISEEANTLIFSLPGAKTVEFKVGSSSIINITLEPLVEEQVKTAYEILRNKNNLGYSITELNFKELSEIKHDNLFNSMTGKVAGVNIRNTGNSWGSTDINIRGKNSFIGLNQPLYVIDGIPLDNTTMNQSNQQKGRYGYDYGDIISDIIGGEVEKITVLKGGAASAIYGSKGANGVLLITTRKGSNETEKNKIFTVNVNSNITIGTIDKSTFPEYQKKYGAGYGKYYYSASEHPGFDQLYDIDGDGTLDFTVPYYEDASRGEAFDPNLMVYQWDAAVPESPNYMKKTSWVAAANGPETFFQHAANYTNNVSVNAHTDLGSFRLSYTNANKKDIIPNSSLHKNNILLNGSLNILKRITLSGLVNFTETRGKGRNTTGYIGNTLTSFRQWYQMNADIKSMEDIYFKTKQNISWNHSSFYNLTPAYWDNPYWTCYENFETDERNHTFGMGKMDITIFKGLNLSSQASFDNYNVLQEERRAIGSISSDFGVSGNSESSGYSRFTRDYFQKSFNLLLQYQKQWEQKFDFNSSLGAEYFKNNIKNEHKSTEGGLVIPNFYNLNNSTYPISFIETENTTSEMSYFGTASIGFNNLLFLEGNYRLDKISSILNDENKSSTYSISGGLLLNKFFNPSYVQNAKLRLNYASAKNMIFSFLDPEQNKTWEPGLEMACLNNRIGFDVTYFSSKIKDNILLIQAYTGLKYINTGEVENSGFELTIFGTPIKTSEFNWNTNINFWTNKNKVNNIYEGITNAQLATFQDGISLNATKGQSIGTIMGTDYQYHENGGKLINPANGRYYKTSTNHYIIGNINPDWKASIQNSFTYKDFSLSFLFDIQHGGDIFSLDLWYGMGAGLYKETAGLNDLGNEMRDPIVWNNVNNTTKEGGYATTSGGVIEEGVINNPNNANAAYGEDGSKNWVRRSQENYTAIGWVFDPNARFIYDASYVKLRELVFTYQLPQRILNNLYLSKATISLVGSNLWIISKNLPYADPEFSHGPMMAQGWQSGVMPAVRNFGITLNLVF